MQSIFIANVRHHACDVQLAFSFYPETDDIVAAYIAEMEATEEEAEDAEVLSIVESYVQTQPVESFARWARTRTKTHDFQDALLAFGDPDADTSEWSHVLEYESGVIVALKSGEYYTHVGTREYTGDLATVERRLWEDHASHELRI